MTSKLSSFFATRDFDAAWHCYQDWCRFQQCLELGHQVELAGCRINGYTCWDVRVSQELHNARAALLDDAVSRRRISILRPLQWGMLLALPLAVVGLSGGVWPSSTRSPHSLETEAQKETQPVRRNRWNEQNLAR